MTSRWYRWTEAELKRNRAKSPPRPRTRPLLKLGDKRPPFSTMAALPNGYRFVWVGYLPRISGHQVNRFARSRLAKMARMTFGVLPPMLCATRRAQVEIVRILGPGQHDMDDDSIGLVTGGLRDGLKPSYLVDDAPRWATFTYRNDGTRRAEGPAIEITIRYQENIEL